MPRETTLDRMCAAFIAASKGRTRHVHAESGADVCMDGFFDIHAALRAALQAARDGTSDAIFNRFDNPGDAVDGSDAFGPSDAEAVWHGLIDAILTEKPDGEPADAA